MAINKNFVVKNGLEVSTSLIFADADNRRIGFGNTLPEHFLHVSGGIGATDLRIVGTSTFVGISTFGNNVYVSGISTLDSGVSTGQTALTVIGDLRVTGDIIADDIEFDIGDLTELNVTGIGTINTLYTSGGNIVAGFATINNNAVLSGITTISNLQAGVATEFFAATGIQSGGVVIGGGVTTINFAGVGATLVTVDGTTANVYISGGPGISSVGIQSGGSFVGNATTINFVGAGISQISINDNIASVIVGFGSLGYATESYVIGITTSIFPFIYNKYAVEAYYNGSKLVNGSDFIANNGTTVNFNFNAGPGDTIDLVTYRSNISPLQGQVVRRTFAAAAGNTKFTFSGGYSIGNLDVYLNGSKLILNTDYIANDGITIVLTEALDADDVLEAVSFQSNVIGAGGSNFLFMDDNVPIGLASTINFGYGIGVTGYDSRVGIVTVGLTSNLSVPGILTVGTFSPNNLTVPGNVDISGITTMGNVIVGGATTDLLVNGNARITGILTIGTSSITLDPNNDSITASRFVGTGSSTVFTNVSFAATEVTYSGTGTSERTTSSKLADILSVKDFGAVGDGITDDTAAIQSAIDALSSGDELYFPTGNYLVSRNVSAGKDAQTQGQATYRSLKISTNNISITAAKGANLYIDATDSGLQVDGEATVILYIESDDVDIDGLSVISATASYPAAEYSVAIEADNVERLQLSNITVGYHGAGVRFTQCTHCDIRDSYIYNCTDTGFNGWGGCYYCSITNSRVDGSGDGNCTFYGGNYHCEIRGCYFEATASKGSQLAVIESSHYSTIRDCVFDGTNGHANNGPIMNRSRFSSIKGNRIFGMQYGIIVRETDISGSGGIPNWAAVVSDNEISDCQTRISGQRVRAIWLDYCANVLVTNNRIVRTEKTGTGPTAAEIEIRNPGIAGFALENIRIVDNTFQLKHNEVGFGFFSQIHHIVYSNQTLERFTFSGNTVICAQDNGSSIHLLTFTDLVHSQICGNTFSDLNLGNGPFNILYADSMTECMINDNILPYRGPSGGVSAAIQVTDLSMTTISNNVVGTRVSSNGTFIGITSTSSDIIFTGNIVDGCSRLFSSDSTPSNLIVTSNIVYYDFASAYQNVTPAVDANNIFTNY